MDSVDNGEPRLARFLLRVRSPVFAAFIFAAGLRLFYSALGALVAPHLFLDPTLIRSNGALAERLPPPSGSVAYRYLGVWERFDTLWYLQIAQFGYNRPETVVFFPLYPLLIRGLAPFLGGMLQAALTISSLASFVLFWGILKLTGADFSDTVAVRALLLIAFWPGSFIFFAGYADSLVLGLTVCSLYWGRTQRWWLSSLAAFLAGFTKAVGILVVIPLIFWAARNKHWRSYLPILSGVLGSAIFILYLRLSGHPLPSVAYAEYWGTLIAPPWRTLAEAIERIYSTKSLVLVFNLWMLILMTVLSLLRLRPYSYLAYALASLCLFLSKRSDSVLQSTCRYALAVFPAYINLARFRTIPLLPILVGGLLVNTGLAICFFKWSLIV